MALNQEQTLPSERRCPSCGLSVQSMVTVCPRDGTNLVQPLHIDPAFAKYEFISGIGAGGMGVIYKARHTILNRMVAIKTLHSHLASPEAIRRFEIEGKAASLLSHPNIITVYDIGVTLTGQPYMIMDFVDGQTMTELLQTYGQIPLNHFLRIFLQVSDALAHAHKRSVLHRDIKPSNLMLIHNERGEYDVRIMDFGIAKVLDDTIGSAQHLTKTGEAIGSPIYMSPEQARGQKMDHRSDLYSLGCVMYEALTGSVPFLGNTSLDTMLMHMEKLPMPLRQASMGSDLDPRLEQIVMKLLQKNPTDRYQSMDELHTDLVSLREPAGTVLPSMVGLAAAVQKNSQVNAESGASKLQISTAKGMVFGGVALIVVAICLPLCFYLSKPQPVVPKEPVISHAPLQSEISELSPGTFSIHFNAKQSLKRQVEQNAPIIYLLPHLAGRESITDRDLSVLKKATLAKKVNLEAMNITDEGLENLRNLKSILLLEVSSTHVKSLKILNSLPSLQALFVNRVALDPIAYVNIGKAKQLRELHLENSPITDAGLANFYQLHALRGLDLTNSTQITTLGVDKLRNQLPACEIKHATTLNDGAAGATAGSGEQTSDTKKNAGPMPSFQEAKVLAESGHWLQANDKVTQSLDLVSPQYDREAQSKIYALKGDCQFQLKLPKSAAWYYIKAIYLGDPNNSSTTSLQTKLAGAYEAFSEQPDGRILAAGARSIADQEFKRLNSGSKSEVLLRQENLERLAQDSVYVKDHITAERYLNQVVEGISGDRKARYMKMLESLRKTHS